MDTLKGGTERRGGMKRTVSKAIAFALGFLWGFARHPVRVVRGLWQHRGMVWAWLDQRLGHRPVWQRYNARRRLRLVAHCARLGHPIVGTLLPNGEPGKMCPRCHYVQQITPHEFKFLFGMNVATAVARTRAEGTRVHNARTWARTHTRPGLVKPTGAARVGR